MKKDWQKLMFLTKNTESNRQNIITGSKNQQSCRKKCLKLPELANAPRLRTVTKSSHIVKQ
jgi:hypothetical protein